MGLGRGGKHINWDPSEKEHGENFHCPCTKYMSWSKSNIGVRRRRRSVGQNH